jgi:predicted glutamine amidotransferase
MCGLFGFNGWDKGNVAKLKILGLYNKSRGKDSCGYFFNNQLVKGVDKVKEWDSFIESEVIEEKGVGKVFIGHTRASTVGGNTADNAHPFNVNGRMILAHNGTIDNIWSLCNKYGIDTKGIHVDSLALGHLIDLMGFRVLEEYRGYAALLVHRLNEPDTTYIYHGASRTYLNQTLPVEERPLFLMKTKEGIYFSSMKNALMAIRDSASQEPEMVDHNRVIKITKGKFARAKTVIRREDVNVGLEKKTTTYTGYPPTTTTSIITGRELLPAPKPTGITSTTTPATGANAKIIVKAADNNGMGTAVYDTPFHAEDALNIYNESLPPRCYSLFEAEENQKDMLFYWRGRHYRADGNVLADGTLFVDKGGYIYGENVPKTWERYFFRGVMLRDKKGYEEILDSIRKNDVVGQTMKYPDIHNFAQMISRYSMYPVTNLEDEYVQGVDFVRNGWSLDLKAAKGSVQPLWSDRNYIFSSGNLVKIISEKKNDVIMIPVDGSKHVNQKEFSKGTLLVDGEGFQQGELFVRGNASNIELDFPGMVKLFDMTYDSEDQVMRNSPEEVIGALNLYVRDLLLGGHYYPDDEEVANHVSQFIQLAVNDKVTLRENMDDSLPQPEEYLRKAIAESIARQEEDEDDEEAYFLNRLSHQTPNKITANFIEGLERAKEQSKALREMEEAQEFDDDALENNEDIVDVDYIDVSPIVNAVQTITHGSEDELKKKTEQGEQGEAMKTTMTTMMTTEHSTPSDSEVTISVEEKVVGSYPAPVKTVAPVVSLTTYLDDLEAKQRTDDELGNTGAERVFFAVNILRKKAMELQLLTESGFALSLSTNLHKGLDLLINEVQSSLDKYHKSELVARFKQIENKR